MSESFENKEVISELAVIAALDEKGYEDEATKELVSRYIDQCHADAEAAGKVSPALSTHANTQAEINIALTFLKTKNYKDAARESLVQILEPLVSVEHRDPSVGYLVEQILILLGK